MIRRLSLLLALVLVLAALPVAAAADSEAPALDLPPGIAAQAQPLLAEMMQHMEQMDMSPAEMQMMMADMQAMADQLPPGIFLQLLRLMPKLSMSQMMALHQALQQSTLLQQSPGQVLKFVHRLAS